MPLEARPRRIAHSDRLLVVDLSTGSAFVQSLSDRDLDRFVGGSTLAAALLLQHLQPRRDPLGPDNILVLAPGALTGAPVPGSDRLALAAKSPQTGLIGESTLSGPIGEAVRRAGYAAVVIAGAASAPCCLVIDDDGVRLVDTAGAWGLDIPHAVQAIRREVGGRGFEIMAIGQAGENLVRFACVADASGRVAGRTGIGAVMGSKKLKAVCVRGTALVGVQVPEGLRSYIKDFAERLKRPEVSVYGWSGSVRSLATLNRLGALPAANFQHMASGPGFKALGDALMQKRGKLKHGCVGCPVQCEHRFERPGVEHGGRETRLEYQTVYSLGPLCGVDNLGAIVQAARMCDDYGMDTLSMGATIAWAMETNQRGLLAGFDTGDMDLRFGNSEAVLDCIRLTAQRRGVGALLAEGSRRAAELVGGGSQAWSMQVKGLEMPGYDPRHHKGLGLGLALSARGACHNRAGLGLDSEFGPEEEHTHEDVVERMIAREDLQAYLDTLGICKFFRHAFDDLVRECGDLLYMVCGRPSALAELPLLPQRLQTLRRIFNLREGLQSDDDRLPSRLLDDVSAADFAALRRGYYQRRGWTESGEVRDSTLHDLDITDFAVATAALQPV